MQLIEITFFYRLTALIYIYIYIYIYIHTHTYTHTSHIYDSVKTQLNAFFCDLLFSTKSNPSYGKRTFCICILIYLLLSE